uniref:RRN3 homolog, RNA polymerase I transcription factor n=1 Tax=Sphenodon punctatus TaxID=8508 RepID=A0A8D0GQF7_SPHPU
MLAGDDFISSPPKKTVRFGGSLTDVLLKYQKGGNTDFELLKQQLSDPDIKDDQIINWLHEFRASVAYLTKEFEQLVSILLKLPWLRRSKEVVEEYLAFLGNLVSAQTIYLRPCLAMIVSHLIPRELFLLTYNFSTCHRALQTITGYVPLTPHFLMPILVEKFPFINKSEKTLECYVHNLLRISVYIPTLRHEILELIVERLLKMDVSASRKDIENAEESANSLDNEENATEEGLFDMDEDEETEGKNGRPDRSDIMAHPIAERLDILMTILFSFIKDVCHVDGKLDVNNTKDLYRNLVSVFDKLILPTHGSCHVQYVMFYICSFKLGFAEVFLEHLWKKLQNPNNSAVVRQTAGNYIGSFLARAKFIPVVTVKACLDLLVNWLHGYIDDQGSGAKAFCDIALHGPFYSACQAVFYVVIFRHRQILEGNLKKGLEYLQILNLERIIMCQLNPLKICLSSIVGLFASITRSNKIINPVYQIWEELSVEDLQQFEKPCKAEDDDDFLKGETPQNDGMIGITPSSYDSAILSPASSVGSPLYFSSC